jgi:hypothetical protein
MNQLYDQLDRSQALTEPSSNKSSDRDRDNLRQLASIPLDDLPETVATGGPDVLSRDQASTTSSAGLSEDSTGSSADAIENPPRSSDSQSDDGRTSEPDGIISTVVSADNSSGSGGVGNDPPESTISNDEIIDNLLLEFSQEDFVDGDKGLPLNLARRDDADGSYEEYISIHEDSLNSDDTSSDDREPSDSDDISDDSTAVLEQKLEEIEKELFTDSMESFRKSLTEMF